MVASNLAPTQAGLSPTPHQWNCFVTVTNDLHAAASNAQFSALVFYDTWQHLMQSITPSLKLFSWLPKHLSLLVCLLLHQPLFFLVFPLLVSPHLLNISILSCPGLYSGTSFLFHLFSLPWWCRLVPTFKISSSYTNNIFTVIYMFLSLKPTTLSSWLSYLTAYLTTLPRYLYLSQSLHAQIGAFESLPSKFTPPPEKESFLPSGNWADICI